MAAPANLDGHVAYPKTAAPQSPVPHSGQMPYPGAYIPRAASMDASHARPQFSTPSNMQMHTQHHDHATARSANNSPVAGHGSSNPSGKSQTVFIHKLFDMLEDPALSHLIWWSPTQDSFCLYPGEEFSNVLAQYFKHTNIASFIRQLNMYGFHKVNDNFQNEDKSQGHGGNDQNAQQNATANSGSGSSANPNSNSQHGSSQPSQTRWEFRHSANYFRKGDLESLNLIKRKSSKVMSSQKEIVSLKSLPPTSTSHAQHEDPKAPKDASGPESYHSSVYQQSWNQLGVPVRNNSTSKEHPRQPSVVYGGPAPVMGQYAYPVYAQSLAIPHSPSSPGVPDQMAQSPSYFLQQPSHQQGLPQPLSQPQSRQTSVHTPGLSVESSINFKLIEMNTAINGLRAAYSDLLARHESLSKLHQKGQTDLLQLTEIVEKLTKGTSNVSNAPIIPKADDEMGASRKDDVIDRKLASTPINRISSPGPDSMSPTTVQVPKSADLASFKNQLKSKINNPPDQPTKPQPKPHQSYHLSGSSRPVPVQGIVPQAYPLNPNYTLYNSGEGAARHPHVQGEEQRSPAARPHSSRQVSVMMDPLHAASGSNSIAKSAEKPAGTEKLKTEDTQPYVQQYQPFVPAHAYYQHIMHHQGQIRTSSLPTISHPLPQRLAPHTQQRHSLNSLVHYEKEGEDSATSTTSSMKRPSLTTPTTSGPELPAPGAHPAPNTLPAPMAASASRPLTALQEPVTLTKTPLGESAMKKTLPSMEELNKSLRSGSPAGPMFSMQSPGKSEDEHVKRRKIEE